MGTIWTAPREILEAKSFTAVEVTTMMGPLVSLRRRLVIAAIFTVLPGISAFLVARHQATHAVQASGSLSVDGLWTPQATIDIGKVWSGGASVQREFTLENRTGHKITIKSVESDCGCTVPNAVSGALENRESTRISVVFWPPTVANDRGGEFRRTITVTATTFDGTKSIPLALVGFVEPDASLRVFPVNVDIDGSFAATRQSTILHFKGSASILASLPDTLLVTPGRDERLLVQIPRAGAVEAIETKDVQIRLLPTGNTNSGGDWVSAITFAPDQLSDGLTINVRGRDQSIIATPPSVILTDDPAGHDATVRFTSRIGCSLSPESVETDLPLVWNFVTQPTRGNSGCTLRLGVRKQLTGSVTGTLRVRLGSSFASNESISIPVVLLHCDSRETS
jgi:uncharacterized protein DUF1573